jgi:hypothetical protein
MEVQLLRPGAKGEEKDPQDHKDLKEIRELLDSKGRKEYRGQQDL